MADQHDRLLKDLLTNREFSVSFLRQHMPQDLVPLIDWKYVKLDSANVEHVRQQHKDNDKQKELSDLTFTFKFKDGRLGACFVHIEMQTSDDVTIIVRTRHYQTSYLLDFIKRNKGVKKLPLVVSIIYYANEKPFSHSFDIYDHFENVALAKEFAFTTQFVDLSRFTDEEILQHGYIAGLECILKHVAEKNVDAHLEIISHAIKTYDSFARQTLIRYLANHSGMEKHTLSDTMINNEPELEGDMRTVAQQWIDEGIQKGMVQAKPKYLAQGIEKGIERGIETVAYNMLDEGADIKFVAKTTGLTEAQLKAIKAKKMVH